MDGAILGLRHSPEDIGNVNQRSGEIYSPTAYYGDQSAADKEVFANRLVEFPVSDLNDERDLRVKTRG